MHAFPMIRGTLMLAAALLLCPPAHAQLFRAYLAVNGNDANPCTLPAPCRLLPAALNAVSDGGEIWMLDSANYNTATVTIAKSVTILAVPGVQGSVVATGGNAITIATAGVKVALRGLVIVPLPGAAGVRGIEMTNGERLTLQDCLVSGMPSDGIRVAGAVRLRMTDTTVRDNNLSGLVLEDGAMAAISRSSFLGNGFMGVWAIGNAAGTTTKTDISDSLVTGNGLGGLRSQSNGATATVNVAVRGSSLVQNYPQGGAAVSSGGPATLSIANSLISGNAEGVIASGTGARAWLSGNIVSGNSTGFWNYGSGAVFESAGDNAMRNNGTDTTGTIGTVTKQ